MKYNELSLGTIEAVFDKLGGIEGARRFLCGNRQIVTIKHLIDCDALPSVHDEDWSITEHRQGGQLEWDPERVSLHSIAESQRSDTNDENFRRINEKPVLNACVLDYLLANQYLIPEEWKYKRIFFWGTRFCRSPYNTMFHTGEGRDCVKGIYWNSDDDRWCWEYSDIDPLCRSDHFAVVLAN